MYIICLFYFIFERLKVVNFIFGNLNFQMLDFGKCGVLKNWKFEKLDIWKLTNLQIVHLKIETFEILESPAPLLDPVFGH